MRYSPPKRETYELTVEGQRPGDLALQVNGLPADSETGATVLVALHKGINSISITDEADGITGIRLKDCPAHPDYGAFTTYTTYEAENGETNATVSDDTRDYRAFGSEASGRRYVALENSDDCVTVKLTQPADALVIRYCIPDSEDGKGLTGTVDLLVNGERQDLLLSSQKCWVYGRFPWTNDPSTNDGHFFYDDVRVKLDQIYPEGTEITIRKDEMFEYCLIDLIEGEVIPAPIPPW